MHRGLVSHTDSPTVLQGGASVQMLWGQGLRDHLGWQSMAPPILPGPLCALCVLISSLEVSPDRATPVTPFYCNHLLTAPSPNPVPL